MEKLCLHPYGINIIIFIFRWTIFNDEKVAESEEPPKDLGYLYFYKRKDVSA